MADIGKDQNAEAWGKSTLFYVLLIILLGFAVRGFFSAGSRFPLNDGGFFYVMVGDLLANDFALPAFSSFNQADIPFLYPPFGFYFVGLIESLTGADRLQLFRIIPPLLSTVTIPALYFLAHELLKEKWTVLAATLAYALLPLAAKWLIQGGGVTRAFGALFGLLALAFLIRFLGSGRWGAGVLSVLFCGLTVLSHPEWAWFLFYSALFLTVVYWVRKADARVGLRALLVGLGTAVVILPWLWAVLARHGATILQPFRDSGFSRGVEVLRFLMLKWTDEELFPVLTVFALLGILASVKARQWLPVIWLVLTFVLQGRAADQKAVVPLALLAGLGIRQAGRVALRQFGNADRSRVWLRVFLASVVVFALFGSLVAMAEDIRPLTEDHLQSFEWIRQHTPDDARVLVISGEEWVWDNYAEWLTALTGRVSVAQVQGYEWLPGFSERIAQYDRLNYEYTRGLSALLSWMALTDIDADYLVLAQPEPVTLANWEDEPALHQQDAALLPGAESVYENESVLILDLSGVIAP
ncbi:glycosyltransferase family 39 protein [bacterium]|nr:glycosyltransferase family 39 protein [bacterium]